MGTHIFPGRGQCHQVPLPEASCKVDVFLAAVLERHTRVRCLTSRVRVLVFLEFVYWLFLFYGIAPGLFGGRGEMAMAVPCCLPFDGTALCDRADLAALDR